MDVHPSKELFDFLVGFLLGVTVLFLDQADQLLAFTTDLVKIIIGDFSPLFFDLAAKLLPLSGCFSKFMWG